MRFVIFPLHLSKLLRATTACNFSSLICPAGSAPAALASLLFDPPEPQIIWKTQCFVTFLPFRAPRSSFFFSSLLFTDSSHLCFSSVHIVGSLTCKLPSIISICSQQQCLLGFNLWVWDWGITNSRRTKLECNPETWTFAAVGLIYYITIHCISTMICVA